MFTFFGPSIILSPPPTFQTQMMKTSNHHIASIRFSRIVTTRVCIYILINLITS